MSELVEGRKAKERSPAFPFISLERALERARRFYEEEKRGAAPLGRAVMHWEYSPGSSGALQTIAALKQYGLLEDVGGSGANRQLKLSDLALRILVDQREDTTERDENLKIAALNPPVAAEVFHRWHEGLPSDSTLNHFLVIDKKFSESAAATAVKIIKENQLLTQVSWRDIKSQDEEVIEVDSRKGIASSMVRVQSEVPSRSLPRVSGHITSQSAAPTAGTQRMLAHMGVGITLHFTEEPTKEVFEYLARYCNFEKDNVPSKAQQPQASFLSETPPSSSD